MKRSQLKSIANKTGKDIDLYNFRKQRNLVVNLNKKEKILNSLSIENDSKPFQEMCKPYFSNKGIKTSGNIILSDKEGLISKKIEVAREFNIYFQSITSSLGLFKQPNSSDSLNEPEPIKYIVNKYKNHPSIQKIKSKFPQVLCKWTNKQFSDFSDPLKLAEITPIHIKGDPFNKDNYRPISILPLISKCFQKILCSQIYSYIQEYLNPVLSGFWQGHGIQHALF